MDKMLHEVFDNIHASQQLKDNTKQAVLQQSKSKKANIRPLQTSRVAAACIVFLLSAGIGIGAYFVPVSAVHIETEPLATELQVNCFNRIIGISGDQYTQEVLHCRTETAVQTLLDANSADEATADTVITVVGNDGVLQNIRNCTQDADNVHCDHMSKKDASSAAAAGISKAKYNVYLQLLAAGISVTEEQVQQMSMKQLRLLLTEQETAGDCVPDETVTSALHSQHHETTDTSDSCEAATKRHQHANENNGSQHH
ncbi:MAG: hypothetical protein IJO14_10380 [Clostridia bacterium]|nr:hypothetical protein [Clostridia bacterium]